MTSNASQVPYNTSRQGFTSRKCVGAVDGSARPRLGGPGARGPPGPRAPAVCCAVWTYGQQSTWRPRFGSRIGLRMRVCSRGRPRLRAGGARRSRGAAGPSRPGCMLRCVDLWPAVHVQASLGRGSAWVRVNDAAAGSGPGWGARRSRAPGPRAPAVCCAVWTYGQQSTWRPRLCADRLGCV